MILCKIVAPVRNAGWSQLPSVSSFHQWSHSEWHRGGWLTDWWQTAHITTSKQTCVFFSFPSAHCSTGFVSDLFLKTWFMKFIHYKIVSLCHSFLETYPSVHCTRLKLLEPTKDFARHGHCWPNLRFIQASTCQLSVRSLIIQIHLHNQSITKTLHDLISSCIFFITWNLTKIKKKLSIHSFIIYPFFEWLLLIWKQYQETPSPCTCLRPHPCEKKMCLILYSWR